jgi:VanZ family protein
LAASVEFVQIWASPRTVSLNDIVAELGGAAIGIVVWVLWGPLAVRTLRTALTGGPQAVSAALSLYLLAYAAIALFPFDFLVTGAELAERLADSDATVWVPEQFLTMRGLVSLLLKAALMVPLGAVAKLVWRRGVGGAVFPAAALSAAIEIAQWFEFSGRADAISIAIAVLGAWFGHRTAVFLRTSISRGIPWLPTAVWLAAPIYLGVLPILRGWRSGYVGSQQIEDTVASLHWLPFYYHYFTTEQNALASSLAIAASYAPVGAFAWAVGRRPDQRAGQSRPLSYGGLAAAVLATIMEAGGLITTGLRPDPTNVLIAAAAAMVTQRICEWASRIGPDVPRSQGVAR